MRLFRWKAVAEEWQKAAEAAVRGMQSWEAACRHEHVERLDALNIALNLAITVERLDPSDDSRATVSALVGAIADIQLAGDTLLPSPVEPK